MHKKQPYGNHSNTEGKSVSRKGENKCKGHKVEKRSMHLVWHDGSREIGEK